MFRSTPWQQDALRQPVDSGQSPKSVAEMDAVRKATKDPLKQHRCYLNDIAPSPPIDLGDTHPLQLPLAPNVPPESSTRSPIGGISHENSQPRPPHLFIRHGSDQSHASTPSSLGYPSFASPHPLSQPPLTPDVSEGGSYDFNTARESNTPSTPSTPLQLPIELREQVVEDSETLFVKKRLRVVAGQAGIQCRRNSADTARIMVNANDRSTTTNPNVDDG